MNGDDRSFTPADMAALDAQIRTELDARPRAPMRLTGVVLVCGALAGWIASLALSLDKLTLLENPQATLACDINPFISCGTFLHTWQASTFGIPNMFIGLTGFPIMGVVGALLLSRAPIPRWLTWASVAAVTFAFAFVHWLIGNALFSIRALCPWCLLVWAATAPMFFVTVAYAAENARRPLNRTVRSLARSWVAWTLAWYAVIIALIGVVFAEQWALMF